MTSRIKFHIHVDAKEMADDFYFHAKETLGFFDQNFSKGNDFGSGYRVVAPQRHITKRFTEAEILAFYDSWDDINELATSGGLTGYIEGEYIASELDFADKPFQGDSTPPFTLQLKPLTGPPREEFRQTEIHLVMDEQATHPQLIQNLLNTGMYPARLPKANKNAYPVHTAIVFTAQGYKQEIAHISKLLTHYLSEVGGAVNASIKEERIVRYGLFGITYSEVPDIVESVKPLFA